MQKRILCAQKKKERSLRTMILKKIAEKHLNEIPKKELTLGYLFYGLNDAKFR